MFLITAQFALIQHSEAAAVFHTKVTNKNERSKSVRDSSRSEVESLN